MPERYSNQEKSGSQEQYSQGHRQWRWSRGGEGGGEGPQISATASVNALPARSPSLANAASPIERLGAARYAAAPALSQRPPDAMPALSPARRTMQRFSGTGVAPLSAVQHQEQRARIITLVLVSLAVTLVVVSAFLLFNPTVRHPSFGLTPGQKVVTVTSTAVAIVQATPTASTPTSATPTPSATQTNAQPTSTPKPRPAATATPRPTATPVPTPTPIPYGSAATITITTLQQPITIPQTVTACDSCSKDATQGTIQSQFVQNSVTDIWGNFTANTNYQPVSTADPQLTFKCTATGHGQNNCFFNQGTTIHDANGPDCTLDNAVDVAVNLLSSTCTLKQPGYFNFNFIGSGYSFFYVSAQQSPPAGGYDSVYYTVPPGCKSYGSSGQGIRNDAKNRIDAYLNANGLPNSIVPATVSYPNSYYCSDSHGVPHSDYSTLPGYSGNHWDQTQSATGYRFSFTASDAPAIQRQRLLTAGAANAGYAPDQYSFKLCNTGTPVQGQIDLNSKRATISCTATGRALYTWSAQMKQSLAATVKGLSQSAATAKLQSSAVGYDSTSVKIQITSGSYLPTDPSQIQVIIQTPP